MVSATEISEFAAFLCLMLRKDFGLLVTVDIFHCFKVLQIKTS